MTKSRPKFPNKGRQLRKRLLLFILVVLLVLGVAFAVYCFRSDTLVANQFDALASSLTTATPGSSSAPPANPAASNAGGAATTRVPTKSPAVPPAAPPRTAPAPTEPPIVIPPAAGPAPSGSGAVAPGNTARLSVSPFASLPLDQIAATLMRSYAGRAPKQWGEHLAGITSRLPASVTDRHPQVIALTFDACGGKKGASYDAEIISLLREHHIPATIFVTSIWIRNNPEILKDLASDPLFEIAAHGSRHKPCSVNGNSVYGIKGTASFAELVNEVEGNARDIEKATGKRPRWFRSGTAFYDEVAVAAIHDMGLEIAGYSITADQGATLPAARVAERTLAAKNGDILLFHLNHPKSGTREGLKKALPKLIEQGYIFVKLEP